MTKPRSLPSRTPLRPLLEATGGPWRALTDTAIFDGPASRDEIRKLALVDLSPLPRLGFKGRGTIEAMRKRGIELEATPNRAFRQPDGGFALVLSPGEVMLLSNLNGDGARFDSILADWRIDDGERAYPLPRRDTHAWLAVTGSATPSLFSKLCAIDLRPGKFPDLAIAQTSVAKMSAIIVRADAGTLPLYHVLADSAAALYFCSSLLDAGQEFGIRLAGLTALRESHGEAIGATAGSGNPH